MTKTKTNIARPEPIGSICWNILASALFLGFPQIIGGWSPKTGWSPAFDAVILRSFWAIIVLWAVIGTAKQLIKLIDQRYTIRLAIITVATNLATAVTTFIVFADKQLMNPLFGIAFISSLDEESAKFVSFLFGHLNLFIVGIILFALILEIGVTLWRTYKCGKEKLVS
ncbi:hypothetical protein LQZ18_08260 [Lachnospiraceae bacterium ZAX-1]